MSEAQAEALPKSKGPEDRAPRWWRFWLGASLLPLGWITLRIAALRPDWVEKHYCASIFPRARQILGDFTSQLPFPLAQTALLFIGAILLLRLGRSVFTWLRGRRSLGNLCLHGGTWLVSAAGFLYAFFLISWGFNHARQPYSWHANLPSEEVEQGDLEAVLTWLVAECNQLREPLTAGAWGMADADVDGGLDPRILLAFDELAKSVPALAGGTPLLRHAYLSAGLSRLGISGIYSPFTAEAHLNTEIPPFMQPFTAAHEVAHLKGFAREDEANFIAWQVCMRVPDPALRYSGALIAMAWTRHALASVDPAGAARILELLSPKVLSDLDQNRAFWLSKRTFVTELSAISNDAYLKSQGQAEGRRSYGRMVDLIVAERKKSGGLKD
ncbi:MAG: hypothetical protein ACI8X5_003397 [Planctomycetota bacterium]|jgi:hypothetical protein